MNADDQPAVTPRVTAQPLEWEPYGDGDFADKYCGFYISHAPEDEAGAVYHAAWGEGDSESFATLDEAKAWCQREIDSWVRRFAVVEWIKAPPAGSAHAD